MAIMNKCCCCGVRQGSVASVIYSMVLAIAGVIYFGYNAGQIPALKIYVTDNLDIDLGGVLDAFYAIYIVACLVFVFMIIACIIALVGINQNSKGMLIPFMVAEGLHLLWYIPFLAVQAAFLAKLGGDAGYTYIATIILLFPFFIGDVVCLLCVISQYQEYKDGRGQADTN